MEEKLKIKVEQNVKLEDKLGMKDELAKLQFFFYENKEKWEKSGFIPILKENKLSIYKDDKLFVVIQYNPEFYLKEVINGELQPPTKRQLPWDVGTTDPDIDSKSFAKFEWTIKDFEEKLSRTS